VRKARKIVLAALAATATSVALGVGLAPAGSATPKKRTVRVLDYYFSPAKMTVPRNTVVVWKWPAGGGDAHDVVLKKGPRGAKKFASEVFLADERFPQKLSVPGRYSIICTLHPEQMQQTIVVSKR
jgi:plastocyanin